MKEYIFLVFILFTQNVFADNTGEVTFNSGPILHTYMIKSSGKSSRLTFKDGTKPIITKNVTPRTADNLISEANRILWKSAYHGNEMQTTCDKYMEISIDKSKPISVCRENVQATGHAYGFLNKLSQLVR